MRPNLGETRLSLSAACDNWQLMSQPEMKLNLVLKEADIRDNGHCVAEVITDLLGDDDSVHFPVLSDFDSFKSRLSAKSVCAHSL